MPIGDRRPAPANLPALCPELRARLAAEGIEQVFLVQVTVLPELLAATESPLPPSDLCVSAPAGRGTTLAFVLPVVPAVFRQYDADTPLCVRLLGGDTVARGGANWWRWGRAARSPWLIVVSTPGWLMDHITSSEGFSLAHLRYLVIDEADRVIEMAETGWLKAVERGGGHGPPPCIAGRLTAAAVCAPHLPLQKLPFLATLFTTPAELSESFNVVAPQPLKPLVMHHLLRQPDWRRSLVLVNWNEVAHQLELPLSVLGARVTEFCGVVPACRRRRALGEMAALVCSRL
ncbi:ATP-dependent RNA helicase DDX51 [Amphibalanus amphitrite]|uniref:ATP-dependent RNA helicase n=1 Tax=Amphibalanus amphitrite TaxID=1232801 RepID=A0A6A4VMX7_AMPAM|nr:ATP-dependent RNA helicase DDX51 [Amphibalanus amphitrite]